MPLRIKLGIVFAGFLLFTVIIALIIWLGMSSAFDHQKRLYTFNSELERNFQRLQEKEQKFTNSGNQNDARDVLTALLTIQVKLKTILKDTQIPEQNKIALKLKSSLTNYKTSFSEFVKHDVDMETMKSRMLHESERLKTHTNILKDTGTDTTDIRLLINEVIISEKNYIIDEQNHLALIVNQKNQQIIDLIKLIRNKVDDNSIKLKAYRIGNITSTYQAIFNQYVKMLERQRSSAQEMNLSLKRFKDEFFLYMDRESEVVRKRVKTVEQITIGILIIAVLFGILTAFILARLVTKPINLLKTSAQEIEAGNYETTVKIISKDEIGELGEIFNLMAKQLNTNFKALDGYREHLEDKVKLRTIDLENEIVDRKKIEIELIKEKKLFSTVLHWIESIVVVLDYNGYIILFNKAAEVRSGYKFEEVQSQPFWELLILPEDKESVETTIKNVRADGLATEHQN